MGIPQTGGRERSDTMHGPGPVSRSRESEAPGVSVRREERIFCKMLQESRVPTRVGNHPSHLPAAPRP